jgi:hypothetical protein
MRTIHRDRDFYLVVDDISNERFLFKEGVCFIPGPSPRADVVWKSLRLQLLLDEPVEGRFNRKEKETIELFYAFSLTDWSSYYVRGGSIFHISGGPALSSWSPISKVVKKFGQVTENEVIITYFDRIQIMLRKRQFQIISHHKKGEYEEIQEWDSGFSFWLFKNGDAMRIESEKFGRWESVDHPVVPEWITSHMNAGYPHDEGDFVHFKNYKK